MTLASFNPAQRPETALPAMGQCMAPGPDGERFKLQPKGKGFPPSIKHDRPHDATRWARLGDNLIRWGFPIRALPVPSMQPSARDEESSKAFRTAPICHGTNFIPPKPCASHLMLFPLAVSISASKISSRLLYSDTPSAMSLQMMSISSAIRA